MNLKLRRPIALAVSGDKLPTEFRLFVRGWNESEKGSVLFDDKAAKSVMAAYSDWGIDLPIDLEHQMLDVEPGAADPTARDARGWCKLEVRNGELWAVKVRWAPDGAQRLQEKRQRYVSPLFLNDKKTKRVEKLINIALTALPATHNAPALVAATARRNKSMDPSLIKQALEAIEKGDAKSALDILKGLVASAAGAEPDGDEGDGGEGDGAEGITQADEATPMGAETPKVVAESGTTPDGSTEDDDEDDDEDPKKKKERKAMNRLIRRETGASSLLEALNVIKDFKASHLTLETERRKLSADRAVLESAERRQLCVNLIKLGAEFPATVWADPTATKPSKLKARWSAMPIADLRSHVAEQFSARGGKRAPAAIQPPPGTAPAVEGVELTPDEQKDIVALSAADRAVAEKFDAVDWQILRTTPNSSLSAYAQLKSRRDQALSNGKKS